ncbi:hypothetical protein [Halanaerobacter jeridensis]|uniref:Uncharacterized protein n=1 Tax=Halanaerobacter jeridensis TaxID=706427 RepID=A0A938XZI5_9FIRM|nr:hypothetical protein [Halanaerobacter jeridensis]MBM7558195.1 hypothetical protein [Halanaerobacter jeridensis]
MNDEVKRILEKYVDVDKFIKSLSNYNKMWKLNELEYDLKEVIDKIDLSEEEINTITSAIIEIIFHSDFLTNLENQLKKNKEKMYNFLDEKSYSFAKQLRGFIKDIIKDYPKSKISIIDILLKEYYKSMNELAKDSLEFRSLKGIREDNERLAMRQILKSYGGIVESRYKSYLKLLANIFYNCGMVNDLTKDSPGYIARKLSDAFNEHYPQYTNLVDIWEITIRNSNAHNDFEIKNNKILIYNTNSKTGEKRHKKLLSKDELINRFSYLSDRFVPIGAFHTVIFDILIEDFFFGEENYLDDLIKNMKNDPQIKNLR